EAPTIQEAEAALKDINKVLRPPQKAGPGYIDPGLDPFTQSRIKGVESFLALYVHPKSLCYGKWGAASDAAAITMCRGQYCACVLRRMARQYISDRSLLPENPYGNWNESLLVNEDLCQELGLYLQELGTLVTASKVQEWLCREDVMQRHGITKKISLTTAQWYLKAMGFRWTWAP
ncbi:hypothetical protein BT96DRAFT_796455, partial [Gymnopus androsaceus JB14]